MSAAGPGAPTAGGALLSLQHALDGLVLPCALPSTAHARDRARLIRDQLGDYVLPRLTSIDAPLLAVVGGSTGAGKSTLVCSLVRRHVAAASAIRPTTRRPLLLHAPGDEPWFDGDRVLGSLARVRVAEDAGVSPAGAHTPREVEIRSCAALPAGLALLDAPDIDSVVEENRSLAATLLAGADLWIFVTTASRYADAVPWEHLRAAAERDVVTAVVLDRVPDGAGPDVEADLRRRLTDARLADAPIFTIPEVGLDTDGFLPEAVVAPLRSWLGGLAADQEARKEVARRTLSGALNAALAQTDLLAAELDAQTAECAELADLAHTAGHEALERLEAAVADGQMLRGEVLARWQELVGTGELLRSLEVQIGRLRDRLTAALRGRPAPAARVEEAIESSLVALLIAEAQRMTLETERAWRRAATAPDQLATALSDLPTDARRMADAAALVHDWQGDVLSLIRAEGADKRLTARLLSLGVNGAGVALMILVFAHTGGLTGGEIGVAGGTALLAQRLLEAVFGDQAMRTMTVRARDALTARMEAFLNSLVEVFISALSEPVPTGDELRTGIERVREAVTRDVRVSANGSSLVNRSSDLFPGVSGHDR